MKSKIHRLSITLIAILFGVVLVLCLSLLGKGSAPVDNLLSGIGKGLSSIGNKYILNKREHSRSKSLAWFKDLKGDRVKIGQAGRILYGAYDDLKQSSQIPHVVMNTTVR
jgi:hypothetical protein